MGKGNPSTSIQQQLSAYDTFFGIWVLLRLAIIV